MSAIALHEVRKEFPGSERPALESISGEIRAGLITGLVGTDGAGKTTLIRLMAGLMTPTSGTVRIDELDPIADAATLRDRIGYMPQKFGLYEDLSVQENLNLYADLRGVLGQERRDTFEKLLAFTDLTSFTKRLAGRLSGPNGAGKSTTFKMMCGLLRPTSGTARVVGIDLEKSASQARQRLGYMAQKFSLYGDLSVRQNLDFFSGVYGLNGRRQRETVGEMVGVFGLEPHLKVSPDTLPLGFKQRLALACAVMHEPELLFLDEPTSGVDPVTRREFWTHINGLVEKGVTVMVTTHFMDEAEYCDRIGLVFRGKLIATGTPDDLKEMAATDATPDPTMEDAFIELVNQHREEDPQGARTSCPPRPPNNRQLVAGRISALPVRDDPPS